MSERLWSLYILRCEGGTLYTGIAKDVEERFRKHVSGRGARYTKAHKPVSVECTLGGMTHGEALRVERMVKRMPRDKKIAWVKDTLAVFMIKE